MTGRSDELYDYDEVRSRERATAYVRTAEVPVVVLGSRQDSSLVTVSDIPIRRRRGGGGAVLLGPGDLWIDYWIPVDDTRFCADVRDSAHLVGQWWRDALADRHEGPFHVHVGASDAALACFAATGDGEVERVTSSARPIKVVGLTQWRVREGSFVSTVLHAHSTSALARLLRDGTPFDHDSLDTLGLTARVGDLRDAVLSATGAWEMGTAATLS